MASDHRSNLRSALRPQRELALENLVLRQQLAVLSYHHSRPRLTDADRLFWVVLSRLWSGWRDSHQKVWGEILAAFIDDTTTSEAVAAVDDR